MLNSVQSAMSRTATYNTYTNVYIYTNMRTYLNEYTRTHTQIHIYICVNAHIHMHAFIVRVKIRTTDVEANRTRPDWAQGIPAKSSQIWEPSRLKLSDGVLLPLHLGLIVPPSPQTPGLTLQSIAPKDSADHAVIFAFKHHLVHSDQSSLLTPHA